MASDAKIGHGTGTVATSKMARPARNNQGELTLSLWVLFGVFMNFLTHLLLF